MCSGGHPGPAYSPVFEPCGSDRPDSIGVGVHFIFDAFSAQTVIYCWDHPRRDEDCEEFDIPDQLTSLLDMFLCDASYWGGSYLRL